MESVLAPESQKLLCETEPTSRSQLVASSANWSRPIKKTLYTVNIGDYAPEICALTYPLFQAFAKKIGAEFRVIRERQFPDWPVVYEKLQIHQLGRQDGNDWNICVDGDTLIHPEMFDPTEHLHKDTVCHNGTDMAGIRWKYDHYFRRDGRHIGSCNWFTIASDWCLDLWRPLDDLSLEEALANINITLSEMNSGYCATQHLIDDYTLSRNIARFGLKVKTMIEIYGQLGFKNGQGHPASPFMYHKYTISNEQKAREMLALLSAPAGQPGPFGLGWGILNQETAAEYRRRFGFGTERPPRAGRTEPAKARDAEAVPPPGSHIQGWMGIRELLWLHETAKNMESVVEVGSWKGRSTFALCSSGCPRVIAVDHFQGSPEHQRDFGFAHGWSPYPEFERNILQNFQNVGLKHMTSVEAAQEFADGSVDMVFLDGAHEYAAVQEDLAAWESKATRLIAVHARSHAWVQRALDEYFRRPADELIGDIAVFRK
jgi:hypothetical protein